MGAWIPKSNKRFAKSKAVVPAPVQITLTPATPGKYTQQELEDAFKMVQPKSHWKDPINAVIVTKYEPVVFEAVIHFTATVPHFKQNKNGTTK